MERRQDARENLTLMADIRIVGRDGDHRIKVRNLSAGGMMGEGPVEVTRGMTVAVQFPNVGWAEGSIMWVQADRFGVAFCDEINLQVVQAGIAV